MYSPLGSWSALDQRDGASSQVHWEELQSLFENVPTYFAVLSRDGTLLFASRTAEGVSREAVIGTTIYQHVSPQEHATIRAAIGRALSVGHSSFNAASVGSFLAKGLYACDLGAVSRKGEATTLTLVAAELTGREHAFDELRDREERYRLLVEESHDAIFVNTCDGQLVDFNQATLDLLGYTRDELLHMNVARLYVDPTDRERYRAEIERIGWVRDYDIKLRRKDGTQLDGLLTAALRRAKDGTVLGYQGSLRDVTERRRLEREILELSEREQRRISQDLHDGLGQHLTGIAFLSKILTEKLTARELPEATDAAKVHTLITEAINQARNLAKGLQPVHLSTGGLAFALEEMCITMTQLFGIPCEFRVRGDLCVTDPSVATNVYHIAREAVNNAVKYSAASRIHLEVDAAPTIATLLVRDDGAGIRAANTHEGLGLHIMRYRAAMIGGTLDIMAADSGGTVVRCVFPSGTCVDGE